MFELTPVSLWLEDYSGVKRLFDTWRADGVTSLREYLLADPARVKQCADQLKIIKVNPATLRLFEADDLPHLVANLGRVFRDDMFTTFVGELVQLWDGESMVSNAVNYTLAASGSTSSSRAPCFPVTRILGAHADCDRGRDRARDRAAASRRERGLRAGCSSIRRCRSGWRISPASSPARRDALARHQQFRTFTDVHPEFVTRCMSRDPGDRRQPAYARSVRRPDKETLLRRISDMFRDDMQSHFREQLIELWDGKLFQQREVVNYTLDGTELHLHLQFSVLPGYEQDWSLVQVALTDITARKKAEAYLEFLGKHDVLTKLYNRSFYADELNRLERKGPLPVTIIIADLNGLKTANDQFGHAVGDALLRRAGEVLNALIEKPNYAARIGGDEFAILLPSTDANAGEAMMDAIQKLVEINNQFYPGSPLSFSMGAATSRPGERLEATAKRADLVMFEAKRNHYAEAGHGPRREAATAA